MILHHFSLISLLFVEKTEKPYMTLYFTVPKSLIYGVSKILFLIIEDQDIRLLLQSDTKTKLHSCQKAGLDQHRFAGLLILRYYKIIISTCEQGAPSPRELL